MSSISDPCLLQLSSCVKYYWPWFYIKCPLISDPRQLRLCSNFVKKPDSGRCAGVPGGDASPVVAPPPDRRHRLLLGVLVGQRHGVLLHRGHEVGVGRQAGLGGAVDHLEQ